MVNVGKYTVPYMDPMDLSNLWLRAHNSENITPTLEHPEQKDKNPFL